MDLDPGLTESLDRLLEGTRGGALGDAISAGLAGVAGVTLARLAADAPEWDLSSMTWARRLHGVLHGGGPETSEAEVVAFLPWTVDDGARRSAPSGVELGDHQGLWVDGRPYVPALHLVRAPGAHLLVAAEGPMAGVRLTVEAGPAGRIVVLPSRTGEFRVTGAGPLGGMLDGPGAALGGAGSGAVDIARHIAGLEDPIARWAVGADALDRSVAVALGAPRPSLGEPWLTRADTVALLERLLALAAVDPHDAVASGAALELDPRVWRLGGYADGVARATVVAAARAGRADRRGRPDQLAIALSGALERAFHATATGRGTPRASSRTPRNTVDRLETYRTVHFRGPDGLPDLDGRLDLRCLPGGWRGTLCPVQTPESKAVGLVRQLALGSGRRSEPEPGVFDDLSVAAALVPLIGHDDPTRAAIVAKMFRQALVVNGRTTPAVQTGMEATVAESAGVARAPAAGLVTRLWESGAEINGNACWFGPPGGRDAQGLAWVPRVAEGDFVTHGEILAHAPDVLLEPATGEPRLAPGLDALVAFVPWQGWNYEDGIVVSSSFADRATSEHVVTIQVHTDLGDDPAVAIQELTLGAAPERELAAGTPLFHLRSRTGRTRVFQLPEPGHLLPAPPGGPFDFLVATRAYDGSHEIRLRYRTTRRLDVGDKLTTRHGGKGVVTTVLPDHQMPHLPDGSRVEVLLNPVGVLRRLNIGTVLELNLSLARRLGHESAPRRAPRALGVDGRRSLDAELTALGAPGGRLPLTGPDGDPVGPAEGALVGELHLLKLDHRARQKASARDRAGASATNLQPSRQAQWRTDRRVGAPQRIGEMEVWALQAAGSWDTLADLLQVRGEGTTALRGRRAAPSGIRAAAAMLAVAGIGLEAVLEDGDSVMIAEDPGAALHGLAGMRVRWVGSERVGPRCQDVDDLRAQLPEGEQAAAAAKVAGFLVERLTHEPPAGQDGDGREVEEQATRWYLRLAAPVPHPWSTPRAPLPDLEVVHLPPARMIGRAGDPLRKALVGLVATNLAALGAPRTAAAEVADELERHVADLLGTATGPGARHAAPNGIKGRLDGKFGLLRRHGLGGAAVRSGRLVLSADPHRPVTTVGLPGWFLEDLGVPPLPRGHEDVVLLNRSPSLRPYSLVALRAEAIEDPVAQVHPYLLEAIAGDFDGDTVAIHRPADEGAREELWHRMSPAATVRSAAGGGLLAKIDLDVALGWQLLADEAGEPSPDVAARADEVLGGSADEAALARIADLMAAGWAAAGSWGFSVVDLPEPDATETLADYLERDEGPIRRIATAFRAGAGGKAADLTQLIFARGSAHAPNPLIPAAHVAGSYLDGLADTDYFAAAQQSIGALAAKKLVTPHAGALTRALVWLGYESTVTPDDCGSEAVERTPLTCALDDPRQVCSRCYGADRGSGRPVEPGARVGILAAMLIGERSTQLAMKSIHRRGPGESLGSRVAELGGIFGQGSFRSGLDSDPRSTTLAALADGTDGEPAAVFGPALERFSTLLPDVDPVHAEVLMRMLVRRTEQGWECVTRRKATAQRGALTRAVWAGSVEPLLAAVAAEAGDLDGGALVRDLIGGAR